MDSDKTVKSLSEDEAYILTLESLVADNVLARETMEEALNALKKENYWDDVASRVGTDMLRDRIYWLSVAVIVGWGVFAATIAAILFNN